MKGIESRHVGRRQRRSGADLWSRRIIERSIVRARHVLRRARLDADEEIRAIRRRSDRRFARR